MRRIFIVLLMTLLLLMLFPATSFADNPVIKDRFSADPAALTHDGKMYLYTGNNTSQPVSENEVQDQSTTAWPFIVLGSLTILVISFYFRNKRHKA